MDRQYWQKYYERNVAPVDPSLFAEYVMDNGYVGRGDSLIELGSGNGRDARYFASQDINVVAVDQAAEDTRAENLEFLNADFTTLPEACGIYDAVYSRFTLHSVTQEEQNRVLRWSERALKIGGHLCIEVRGQKNGLFGIGEPVAGEPDAFTYEDHYRRFIEKSHLDRVIDGLGLRVVLSCEERGFAPFNGVDDYFIRHVSQKV